MTAQILFVTGTDTGVGKTHVAAALARRAVARGERARYVKPVQTGLVPGEPGSDADTVRAAGIEAHELARYRAPLAPEVAAELEGAEVDVEDLVARVRALAEGCDLLVVEGAGGLLVPLVGSATMADLAARIGAEVVLVARPVLGTLNHTALTLEVAAHRGLTVSEVVVSDWPATPGVTERTNLARLRSMHPRVETLNHDAAELSPE